MKKNLSLLLALVLLIALFAGCGATAGNTVANDSAAAVETPMEAPMAPMPAPEIWTEEKIEYGSTTNSSAAAGAGAASGSDLSAALPKGVKLIYTANIDLESTVFDTAVSAIESLVADCGGYYESSDLNNYSRYRYGYYTVRVPAEKFEFFCATISQMSESGEVLQLNNLSRSAQDISESYYDTEARLTTQQTKLQRLQELLAKAEDMADIITIESAISETEFTIENLTGTLRKYDSLVGYSTISISLSEVYKLSEVEEPAIGFGAKLVSAFKQGCSRFVNNLQWFLLDLARAWVGWLIFIVVVVVVVFVLRRALKKRRARKAELHAAVYPKDEKKDKN